jgi:hypothetical protein
MARQVGPNFIVGTIGNLTYYKMNGKYYVKAKTVHNKRRIKTDKCFALTRRNASWFGMASSLASEAYHPLYFDLRDKERIYTPLLARSVELVRMGLSKEEVLLQLKRFLDKLVEQRWGTPPTPRLRRTRPTYAKASVDEVGIYYFLRRIMALDSSVLASWAS